MKKLQTIITSAFVLGLGAAACDVGPAPVDGEEPTTHEQVGAVDVTSGDEAVEAVEYQPPQRFGIEAWSGVDPKAPHPAAPPTIMITRANRDAQPVPTSKFDVEKLIKQERPALELGQPPR
ncbi:hypothetical protein L6R52_28050 [Myxococcota bacterium]|nr:hypothetical protein [Myxococcota bacterium]